MKEKDFKYSVNVELSYNEKGSYGVKDLDIGGKVKFSGDKDKIELPHASLMVAMLSFNLIEDLMAKCSVTEREDMELCINDVLGKMHELNYLRKVGLENEDVEK